MRDFIRNLAGPLDRQTKRRPEDRRGQHPNEGGGRHPGLLLQRYLCENATGEDGNAEEKRAILQAAINAAVNEEVRALYRIALTAGPHRYRRIRSMPTSLRQNAIAG